MVSGRIAASLQQSVLHHALCALDSIAAQTYRDFEAIIVNDGSTDGSERIAESYPDARFRVVHQANAGPGAARNRGVQEAKGDLIAFLDGDDEWLPGFLEKSLEFLAPHSDAACVTSSYVEYPQNVSTAPLWQRRGLKSGAFRLTPSVSAMRLVHALAFMSPCSTVVRKEVFQRWGGFSTNTGHCTARMRICG